MILPGPGILLIKLFDAEQTTSKGVYLGDIADDAQKQAEVVKIGEPKMMNGGAWLNTPNFKNGEKERDLQIGDKIYYVRNSELLLQDDKLAFLPFERVLGLVIEK